MTGIVATRSHLQTALDGLEDALRTLANEWTGTQAEIIKFAAAIEAAQGDLAKALRELK